MNQNREYSGEIERNIEEEYEKQINEIDNRLNIERKIKEKNDKRRKKVAIQKDIIIAGLVFLTTLGAKKTYEIN